MSRKTKSCPECGSSAHFRCTAGKHIAMVVRAPQTRHLIDELTAGDLLVIFRKQPLDFPIGPSAPQKVLQPHLRDFVATLGATEVISGDEIAVAGAEVLLVGCGQVDLPGDQYGTQNVPSAVRAACLAFDDALTEAERVHARRVLIDASHILDSAGSPMAAALHVACNSPRQPDTCRVCRRWSSSPAAISASVSAGSRSPANRDQSAPTVRSHRSAAGPPCQIDAVTGSGGPESEVEGSASASLFFGDNTKAASTNDQKARVGVPRLSRQSG